MFRNLYYRLFYFPDLRNVNGLKRFGERCINALMGRAKRRSAASRKSSLRLDVEKSSTEAFLKSVQREKLLEDSEYFGIRKKVQTGTVFIIGIFFTECLLAYYSTLVLINGADLDTTLLRWLLAVALTLGAISTSERLLESCLPQRYHNEEVPDKKSLPVILLWTVLLLLVMLGVVAVAEARVRDIEGGHTGSIVYYGFIALSTVLPLIAGTIAWEISRYYDSYKQTRKYRRALRRLDRLIKSMERNVQREEESYNAMLTTYWDRYNDFRSFKETFDQKHGTNGSFAEPLCYDFDEFKRISSLRYGPVRHERHQVAEPIVSGRVLRLPQRVAETPTNGRTTPEDATFSEHPPTATGPRRRSSTSHAKKNGRSSTHSTKTRAKRTPPRRRKHQ
jgi:hypothetical protein